MTTFKIDALLTATYTSHISRNGAVTCEALSPGATARGRRFPCNRLFLAFETTAANPFPNR
jgi:hypothetical protein